MFCTRVVFVFMMLSSSVSWMFYICLLFGGQHFPRHSWWSVFLVVGGAVWQPFWEALLGLDSPLCSIMRLSVVENKLRHINNSKVWAKIDFNRATSNPANQKKAPKSCTKIREFCSQKGVGMKRSCFRQKAGWLLQSHFSLGRGLSGRTQN